MKTVESRTRGLMDVYHLPWNQGCWFVFPEETETGFWMKNTPIPLEVVFLSSEHIVQGIEQMKPQDKRITKCDVPYKYALEVNPGWCDAHDIRVGSKLLDKADLVFINNNI